MYRNFYLSMTTRITTSADLSLIYFTCCWRQEIIPWPGETVSLINNFDLSVARTAVTNDRSVPEIHFHVAGTLTLLHLIWLDPFQLPLHPPLPLSLSLSPSVSCQTLLLSHARSLSLSVALSSIPRKRRQKDEAKKKQRQLHRPCAFTDRLVGLVVKASASRAEDPEFESRLRRDFSGSSHTSDLNIGTPTATWQATGVIGSALGLVGPVSVYCGWVR